MSAIIVEPWAGDTSYFERMLKLSGAEPDRTVCAAGRGSVELMIKLCRDGYARVECLRKATCTWADEGAGVLLITGGTASESLIAVLLRTAGVLRDGGVVAVLLDDVAGDAAVRAALKSLGLEVTTTVFDLSEEVLVAHTVGRIARRALAS